MTSSAKIRIGRLNNVGGVVSELAKVYREMRRGELDKADGERLARVLTQIRGALEVGEIERRLGMLEDKE